MRHVSTLQGSSNNHNRKCLRKCLLNYKMLQKWKGIDVDDDGKDMSFDTDRTKNKEKSD